MTPVKLPVEADGIKERIMSNIRERLKHMVGAEHVVENPDYTSSAVGCRKHEDRLVPQYLVRPADVEQVQQLVKLANEMGFPLIPVSSQAPHQKGGTLPSVPGAVILDLSRMNRILKIDRRHRLALIEPGVTWEQLHAALEPEGLRIISPLLPKQGKSVIATLLDREPLLTPKYQWNMKEPLRSMEIVFGTGDKIYSGMGGHRGTDQAKWDGGEVPLTNAGPHQFDFMKMLTASQGTFGIVTWASVKLEIAQEEAKPLFVQGNDPSELSDFLYKILKFRFGDEVLLCNRSALLAILGDEAQPASLQRWTAVVNVAWGGLRSKERVESQYLDVCDIAQEHALVPASTIASIPARQVMRKLLAVTDDENWKSRARDDHREVFFLTTLDRLPAQLECAAQVMDSYGYALPSCPIYVQPLHQGAAAHCQIVIPTDKDNPENLQVMYEQLSKVLANSGAFYSRPYGLWADIVYGGNAEHTEMTKKMKAIFDPANILNPGKLCF